MNFKISWLRIETLFLNYENKNEEGLIWDFFVPLVKEDLMKMVYKKH
jgi:hypothetical protein